MQRCCYGLNLLPTKQVLIASPDWLRRNEGPGISTEGKEGDSIHCDCKAHCIQGGLEEPLQFYMYLQAEKQARDKWPLSESAQEVGTQGTNSYH